MKRLLSVALIFVVLFVAWGCGEKEEANPQVTKQPTQEQLDLAKASGGDASRPSSQGSDN